MKISNEDAYDIVIVAGQSNADCYGIKKNESFFSSSILELVDKNPVDLDFPEGKPMIMHLIIPTETIIKNVKEKAHPDGFLANFGNSFAKYYLAEHHNHKILLVKAAVGATSFSRKEWGVNNVLYNRLIKMTNDALSTNKDSKIVALLWHQGESDSHEQPELNLKERYEFYYNNLLNQMIDFRNRFGENIPIICGEFVDSWAELKENKEVSSVIEKATKDVCSKIKKAEVVTSQGLLSNGDIYKNIDIIHFSGDSLDILGKRYYESYKKIVGGNDSDY